MLTASGALVAISTLKPGTKALAASTRTGKTQAEPIAAVLVHCDQDLYDLKVRAPGGTSVIKTARSHLFWEPDHPPLDQGCRPQIRHPPPRPS